MKTKTTRNLIIAILISYGVFTLLMIRTGNTVFGYISLAVMALYGIIAVIFWRCPHCRKQLGPLWITCCPKCGSKLI